MKRIGIFDSGVGGITVLKEVLKLFPNEEIIYFGDNLNAPYGDRGVSEIIDLSLKITDFLVYSEKVDIIVIACNTVTGAGIDIIKEKYKIPVIGVVEGAVKETLKITKNNKVGIMATTATVKSQVYPKKLKEGIAEIETYQVNCPGLVDIIEKGWEDTEENFKVLEGYLNKFPKDIDSLILGCTHYPIILKEIKRYFKGNVIDPAKETALSLQNVLELNSREKVGNIRFYVSGEVEKFREISEKILNLKIEKVEKIKL